MSDTGNIPNLDNFLEMCWDLPSKNHCMLGEFFENRDKVKKEEVLVDQKYELNAISSEDCENIHDIVKNKRLEISSAGAKKEDAKNKDKLQTVSREENSCPYFLRQNRNTSLSEVVYNSQSSVLSSGNDPTWSQHKKLDKKRTKKRKIIKREKNEFYSEPYCTRYGFMKRNATLSYSDAPMFTEKEAHCDRGKSRRNSLRKLNSCSEDRLAELLFAECPDLKRKPFDILERNTVNKRKRKDCRTEVFNLTPLKVVFSSRKPDKANIERMKIKCMLLDIAVILNEIESALTDWNYRTRIPTVEEASRLLERLFAINTSLKKEYNGFKYQLNEYDTVNGILDQLRKCEDLQSALKHRIKKINRTKSASKENINTSSSSMAVEDLQIPNLINKEDNAFKNYNKSSKLCKKNNQPLLDHTRVSSNSLNKTSAIDGTSSNCNDPVKNRVATEDSIGHSLLFSDTHCMGKLKVAKEPSISTPAPNSFVLLPRKNTSSENCEGLQNSSAKKPNESLLSPDMSMHSSRKDCDELQNNSAKKPNGYPHLSDLSKCKDGNINDNYNNIKHSTSSNQTSTSTNKTINIKINDKSLVLNKVIPKDSAQVKKNDNQSEKSEEVNSPVSYILEPFPEKNKVNGNYSKKTLSAENVPKKSSINENGSFCLEHESQKYIVTPVSKNNSIAVSDILQCTPLTKLCLLTPTKLVGTSSNKNIGTPKNGIEADLNNEIRANYSLMKDDPKHSNFKLFKRKEIKTLNSVPKECCTNVDLPMLASVNYDQCIVPYSAVNSITIQTEEETPIIKIALQNENTIKILPPNEITEIKLPETKGITESCLIACKSNTLEHKNSNQASNKCLLPKLLNVNLDLKEVNNENKLTCLESSTSYHNTYENPNCKEIPRTSFSNSGIHNPNTNCEDVQLLKNSTNELSSTKVNPTLNNIESSPINTEQFLMVNPVTMEFSASELFDSPLAFNVHELISIDSGNQNINDLQLDLSISDIFADPLGNSPVDIDFDVQSYSEIKHQDNNFKMGNVIDQSKNSASPSFTHQAQQPSHANRNNNTVCKATTSNEKIEFTGKNKINILDVSKGKLDDNINGLLEPSSVLKNNKKNMEIKPTSERSSDKTTSTSKPRIRNSPHNISIKDIKYRRIYSSTEFIQVDNLEDLFTPNVFVW